MNRRTVFVGWALSLLAVGLWARAESQQPKLGQPIGAVITGSDIGFQRIAGGEALPGTINGHWVVRVNGQWLVPVTPDTARPLSH